MANIGYWQYYMYVIVRGDIEFSRKDYYNIIGVYDDKKSTIKEILSLIEERIDSVDSDDSDQDDISDKMAQFKKDLNTRKMCESGLTWYSYIKYNNNWIAYSGDVEFCREDYLDILGVADKKSAARTQILDKIYDKYGDLIDSDPSFFRNTVGVVKGKLKWADIKKKLLQQLLDHDGCEVGLSWFIIEWVN